MQCKVPTLPYVDPLSVSLDLCYAFLKHPAPLQELHEV